MAELLIGQPMFRGSDTDSQLQEIIKQLGAPAKDLVKELVPEFTQKLPQILP
jgi:hypothetical protein